MILALESRGKGAGVSLGGFGGELGRATIVDVGARSGLGDRIMITADVSSNTGAPLMRVTANVRVAYTDQSMIVPGATIPCRYKPGDASWLVLVTGPTI